jgi:Ner family transcriptional regulator
VARKQPDPSPRDWHSADITRELTIRGLTKRGLSTRHGLSPHAVSVALLKKWPRVERIIADALGTRPELIWPSRYASAVTIKSGGKKKSSRPNRGETLLNKRETHRLPRRLDKAA